MPNDLNINNRTIFCKDNLDILQGMNSESVDLIYLDPPFNKNKIFTAPIGSSAEGAEFSDIFREEDVKDEWVQTIKEDEAELHRFLNGIKGVGNHYNFCYLAYMAIRLIECKRILKATGSLYLHCDPTMSHYLKLLLDSIFGEKSFRNEIVWCYKGPGKVTSHFKRKHDIILFYVKSDQANFNIDDVRVPYKRQTISVGSTSLATGKRTLKEAQEMEAKAIEQGKIIEDWWDDIGAGSHISKNERTGYPTQKPLALLERILQASSRENDIVLDPFCGCATTCIAAEKLNRKWIGIDVSIKAFELVKERLNKEVPPDMFRGEPHFSTTVPKRTDDGADGKIEKWVYVISNEAYDGEYKVGIAKDWQARLNAYQTSDPNRAYRLEYKILTDKFRELEAHIHQKFENRHEWVRESLDNIIQEMEKFLKL